LSFGPFAAPETRKAREKQPGFPGFFKPDKKLIPHTGNNNPASPWTRKGSV